MDLINKQVSHNVFGEGNVIKYDDAYVEIKFPSGNKTFVFPDAFGKYLTLIDQKAANWMGKIVKIRERKNKEERLRELKALQEERRRLILEREGSSRYRKAHKLHPSSQSVFWCKPQEKNAVFTTGRVFIGAIKSGKRKGQPRVLARVSQNSACLLTMRSPDMSEKDRRILGVFMVDRAFNARLCSDGYIPAHPDYRLRLSEQEAKKMLFWKYYVNKAFPHKITWNTGRHRYFDSLWMAQILGDIVSLKKDPKEKEYAQQFFDYFCKLNLINSNKLPKPDGGLTRIHDTLPTG